MEDLSLARVAAIGLVFGSTVALGWMGALAARTGWAVHRGGNRRQVRAFLFGK